MGGVGGGATATGDPSRTLEALGGKLEAPRALRALLEEPWGYHLLVPQCCWVATGGPAVLRATPYVATRKRGVVPHRSQRRR
jgi:hypothetical protein